MKSLTIFLTIMVFVVTETTGQTNFQFIVSPRYESILRVTDELYIAEKNRKFQLLNYKGLVVIEGEFDYAECINSHNTIILLQGSKKDNLRFGYYNYSNGKYKAPAYTGFEGITEDKLIFKQNNNDLYAAISVSGAETNFRLGNIDKPSGFYSTLHNVGTEAVFSYDALGGADNKLLVERENGYMKDDDGNIIYITVKSPNGSTSRVPQKTWVTGLFDLTSQRYTIEPGVYEDVFFNGADIFPVILKETETTVYINKQGKVVIDSDVTATFNDCQPFFEGLAAVQLDGGLIEVGTKTKHRVNAGKWGFMNSQGTMVIKPEFTSVESFEHGFAVVEKGAINKTLSGLIDRRGKLVIDCRYKKLEPVENLDASSNTFVTPPTYSTQKEAFLYCFTDADGKQGIITSTGEILVSGKEAVLYTKEVLISKNFDKSLSVLFLNDNNEVAIACDSVTDIKDNLLSYAKDKKGYIINTSGKVLLNAAFSTVLVPHKDYMWVQQDGLWGLGSSSYLTSASIKWLSPSENFSAESNSVRVNAKIRSSSTIEEVRIIYGQTVLPVRDRSVVLNGSADLEIDRIISLPANGNRIIPITIEVKNELGISTSTRVVSLPAATTPVPATTKRLAIIIANRDYRYFSTLTTPLNDLADMKTSFAQMGFTVMTDSNLTLSNFKNKLAHYRSIAATYQEVVFYYSGHGIGILNDQYLIPTDVNIEHINYIDSLAINLREVLQIKTNKEQRFVIVSDACRDLGTQFINQFTNIKDKLKKPFEPPLNSFIWYATTANTTAGDIGANKRNGVFTNALLKYIKTADLPVEDLVKITNRELMNTKTGAIQLSVPYNMLTDQFCFCYSVIK